MNRMALVVEVNSPKLALTGLLIDDRQVRMRVRCLVLGGRIVRVILPYQDSAILIGQKREPALALPRLASAFAHPFANQESERRPSSVRLAVLREERSNAEEEQTDCAHMCNDTSVIRRRREAE